MNIKKGDTVIVLSGKDRGKKGKILRVISKTGKIIVEGVNVVKKHQKPTQKFQGGIIEKPSAIPFGKVQVVCPRCSKKARIGRKDGVRVCKKCGEGIDKA